MYVALSLSLYIYIYIHTYIHIHTCIIHIYIYIYMYIYIHTQHAANDEAAWRDEDEGVVQGVLVHLVEDLVNYGVM